MINPNKLERIKSVPPIKTPNKIELKKTKKIHDRVIFIDNMACWVVGQSLKDAAKAKPTYLSPLSPDVVSAKLQEYNE